MGRPAGFDPIARRRVNLIRRVPDLKTGPKFPQSVERRAFTSVFSYCSHPRTRSQGISSNAINAPTQHSIAPTSKNTPLTQGPIAALASRGPNELGQAFLITQFETDRGILM